VKSDRIFAPVEKKKGFGEKTKRRLITSNAIIKVIKANSKYTTLHSLRPKLSISTSTPKTYLKT
jgi:hypothetical protein